MGGHDGPKYAHTARTGNVSESKTLKAMQNTVFARFDVERVIVVADHSLLSLDNVTELAAAAATDTTQRKLQFTLAVTARRYGELGGMLAGPSSDPDRTSLAEGVFAEHRQVVAHDPLRVAEQSAKRRARITEIEALC